jgi:hypothetical protein
MKDCHINAEFSSAADSERHAPVLDANRPYPIAAGDCSSSMLI